MYSPSFNNNDYIFLQPIDREEENIHLDNKTKKPTQNDQNEHDEYHHKGFLNLFLEKEDETSVGSSNFSQESEKLIQIQKILKEDYTERIFKLKMSQYKTISIAMKSRGVINSPIHGFNSPQVGFNNGSNFNDHFEEFSLRNHPPRFSASSSGLTSSRFFR